MYKVKDVLAFLILEAFILQPVVLSYATRQPYTGAAYTAGIGTTYATSEVIGGTDFHGTNPSTIPTGKVIMSVLSSTGAHGTSFGWTDMYQVPVSCKKNGNLYFTPQIWQGSTRVWTSGDIPMNTYTDYWVFTKMKWSSSTVYFYAYEYKTQADFDRDSPVIYSRSHSRWTSSDTNFIVGVRYDGSPTQYILQFLQLGTEATTNSSSITWQIHNDYLGYYYNSAWYYMGCYAMPGPSSAMTLLQDKGYGPGGYYMYMKIGTHVFTDIQNYNYNTLFTQPMVLWSLGSPTTFTPPIATPFNP